MTTKSSTIFLFSGQGSHYYRMGEELYRKHPVFREALEALDELVQSLLGESIISVLYDPRYKKQDVFSTLRHTHPAIFMVEVALARTMQHEGIEPDYVLGTSMGSFAALTIAGGLSAEQAMAAVIRQVEVIEQNCVRGHMLAVLDDPVSYHQNAGLYDNSSLAGVNFYQSFVVATDEAGLEQVEKSLKKGTIRQRLAVDYAFHSPWLDPAKDVYLEFLKTQSLQPLKLPFICCVEGSTLNEVPTTYLWQVVREPIEFQETIELLEIEQSRNYIDLGPSGTLATFLKYLLDKASASSIHPVMTPYGSELQQLEKLRKAFA